VQCQLLKHEGIYTDAKEVVSSDMPNVKFESFKLLNGTKKTLVKEVGDGSIIKRFDKTPFPIHENDVVCPHFLELKWANGCHFDCAWCYLNGTFRFRPQKKEPYLKDKEKIIEHLKALFYNSNGKVEVLNSGELSDSLVFEGSNFSLTKDILPLFKQFSKHKLLILTKTANGNGIIKSDSQGVVITSFSLNAYPVSERWEHKAPHPRERIKAAKRLFDAGYSIRLRIDPMVPIDGWRKSYTELIDDVFSSFVPERITIGSLRGLQSTINNSTDKTWIPYLDDSSNWGKKITFNKRFDMYHTLIDHLNIEYDYSDIGLCKETIEMWEKLGLDYKNIKCNCTP